MEEGGEGEEKGAVKKQKSAEKIDKKKAKGEGYKRRLQVDK